MGLQYFCSPVRLNIYIFYDDIVHTYFMYFCHITYSGFKFSFQLQQYEPAQEDQAPDS